MPSCARSVITQFCTEHRKPGALAGLGPRQGAKCHPQLSISAISRIVGIKTIPSQSASNLTPGSHVRARPLPSLAHSSKRAVLEGLANPSLTLQACHTADHLVPGGSREP